MIKEQVVKKISKGLGLRRTEVSAVLDGFFQVVLEALKEDEKVEIRDFGVFHTKIRKGRYGRNINTMEEVWIESRRMPVLKFSKRHRNL